MGVGVWVGVGWGRKGRKGTKGRKGRKGTKGRWMGGRWGSWWGGGRVYLIEEFFALLECFRG